MKRIIHLLLSAVLCNCASFAQMPSWSWAEQTIPSDTAAYCFGYGTAADASGNVYVTGSYSKSNVKFANATLSNAGGYDFFIAKYDRNGNLLWVKNAGGLGNEEGLGIAMDKAGYIYVTGYFASDTLVFGASSQLINASSGHTDIFVVKYDSTGNVVWANNAGGTGDEKATAIATDPEGNLLVTGIFNDTFNFGSTMLTNPGDYDIFTAKYDNAGNVMWAKSAGGNQYEAPESIATDTAGNVYVVGEFYSDTMVFGAMMLYKLSGVYYQDIFVAMYDASGNLKWAERQGGELNNFCKGICSDAAGNVIVTGYYTSAFMNVGTSMLHGPGTFVAKISSSGNVIWANGTMGGQSNGVACGIKGNGEDSTFVYIAGSFSDTSLTVGTTILNNALPALPDIFVASYSSAAGDPLWAMSAGGTDADIALSIATNASGDVFTSGYFESTSLQFNTTTLHGIGSNYFQMFTAKITQSITTSIAEPYTAGAFTVYPNPFSDMLYISTDNGSENNLVNVFNSLGEKVYSEKFTVPLIAVNLKVSPGIYFVQLVNENDNRVMKIVRN